MENTDTFERARLEVAGRGVTITSWYDAGKHLWRANAPAFQHLLGDSDKEAITGATRERAVNAIQSRLAQQFTGAPSNRR